MKHFDDEIKAAFKNNMQKIDDVTFTDNIVKKHLAQKDKPATASYFNFTSIIFGVIMIIISCGLYFLIYSGNEFLADLHLETEDGLIILLLAFMFLFFKWLDGLSIKRMTVY